jgi:hypothetical protein
VFETKSYNDLRKTIYWANVILAAGFLIFLYLVVLVPNHKHAMEVFFQTLRLNPVLNMLVTVAVLAGVWGYLTTFLFRLHDRVYEPRLVNWRASYEADFILRSLCWAHCQSVSPRLFIDAFEDAKKRHAFMQRLFYKFVGDQKPAHQELLERFYTSIRNYWVLVLAETYCIGLLTASIVYLCFFSPSMPPFRPLLGVVVAAIGLRVWSNHYLPKIRLITIEQIHAILEEHEQEFESELDSILDEYGLRS